jgi:WD40 repeat protein
MAHSNDICCSRVYHTIGIIRLFWFLDCRRNQLHYEHWEDGSEHKPTYHFQMRGSSHLFTYGPNSWTDRNDQVALYRSELRLAHHCKIYKAPRHESGSRHVSSRSKSLFTMNEYHLRYTLQSLEGPMNVMEFSPDGKFLIVGEGQPARLRVFDRLAGFCPAIEADTISQPTSLAFESSTTFLAGLDDGRFVEYSIDLKSKRLVKGRTNSVLRGPSLVSALALDEKSQTLALAVGPSVFVFRRVSGTGETLV